MQYEFVKSSVVIPIAVYRHFSAIRSRLKGLGPASALGSEQLQPTTFIVKLLLCGYLYFVQPHPLTAFQPFLYFRTAFGFFDNTSLAEGIKGNLLIVPFPLQTSASYI